jgi:hypothetical protein
LQARRAYWESRGLAPVMLILVLHRGEQSTEHHRHLITGERTPQYTIEQETWWSPELVWTFWRKDNFLPSCENQTLCHEVNSLVTITTELSQLHGIMALVNCWKI